jgi:CubicO group peptidase (beta-lactamase class C family)
VCRSTWEDYIAGNIFKPLGMGNTTTAPPADLSTLGGDGVGSLLASMACVS